ncbi:MAG: hypothetical protein K8U03_11415 [Planctomycetia bacterium]|nr:hypothetical protein [Planctomycetia bacterium]
MTQAELENELARSTGDSLSTIRRHGFNLVEVPDGEPLPIDWDELQQFESLRYPPRRRPVRRQLAA